MAAQNQTDIKSTTGQDLAGSAASMTRLAFTFTGCTA
jgi:hypothetical protein